MPYVHIKTAQARRSVCNFCKNYNRENMVCGIDKQNINLKIFLNNCPENKWPIDTYFESHPSKIKKQKEPPLGRKIKTFFQSIYRWAKAGFLKTGPKQLAQRMEICKGCEFWDKNAWNGTGKCTKCGCSTWAKLRIRTEKCPIGKW